MKKLINSSKKKIKNFLDKHDIINQFITGNLRFITFFLFGIFVVFLFSKSETIGNILTPFLLIPQLITNFFESKTLSFFNSAFFWNITISGRWYSFFYIITGIYNSVILTLLTSNKKRTKKIILWILLILFLFSLFLKIFDGFSKFILDNSSFILSIGSNNLRVFLGTIFILFCSIFILKLVTNKISFWSLLSYGIKYIFLLGELFLTLYIGIMFVTFQLQKEATLIDIIFGHYLYYFFLGFLFFLILNLVKNFLLEKIEERNKKINSP